MVSRNDLGTLSAGTRIDTTGWDRGLGKMNKGLDGMGRKLQGVGRGLTLGLTAPIIGFGAAVFNIARNFQAGMNRVRALTGATGDDFEALTDQAKDLGLKTQFSATQAADAMGFLAQAGFETNEIIGAMPGTLTLAASAQIGLAEAADIVTNVLTGYGIEVEDIGRVTDVLVKSFTSANTDLVQLGQAMKFAGPVASAMGLQFEEVAAAIGLMGNAGIQATMAGTAIRGALVRLANPAKSVTKILNDLSIEVFNTDGSMVSLVTIIQQLEESGISAAQVMEIFGQRAGPAMLALLEQGSFALSEFTTELENSGGTAQRIADIQMEGLNGAIFRLKAAFEGLAIALADVGLLDFFVSTIEGITNFLLAVAGLDESLLQFILILAAVAAAIGPLLLIIGTLFIVMAAISAPILIIILVIAALIIGIAALIVWWDDLVRIVPALGVAWELIKKGLRVSWDAIVLAAKFMWEQLKRLWEALPGIASAVGHALVVAWQATWDKITDLFNVFKDLWFGNWEDLYNALKHAAIVFGKAIVVALAAVFKGLLVATEILQRVWIASLIVVGNFLKKHFESIKTFLIALFKGLGNILIAPILLALEGLRQAWNALAGNFNSVPGIHIPNWVPGIGGKGFDFPKMPIMGPLPSFAEGGVVPGPAGSFQAIGAHGGEVIFNAEQLEALSRPSIDLRGATFGTDIMETEAMFDRILRRHFGQGAFEAGVNPAT